MPTLADAISGCFSDCLLRKLVFYSVNTMSGSRELARAKNKEGDETEFVILRLTRAEAEEVLKLIREIRKKEAGQQP